MDQFGAYLKSQRESKGIRLEEIASITKIHLHSLEMLEASRWEALPPEPFIRGFIIAYAKYVGLQPKEALEKYFEATGKKRLDSQEAAPAIAVPPAEKEPGKEATPASGSVSMDVRTLQPTWIAAGVAIVFFTGLMVTLISIGKRETETTGPSPASIEAPQTTATPAAPGATPAPAATPAPTENRGPSSLAAPSTATVAAPPKPATAPVAAASAAGHEVVVQAKERSWLKVVTDENLPAESFIEAGVRQVFKADKKIKVTLGNAAGAEVSHNGQPVEGTQFMGTIRYFKFPPTARFPQDVRVKRATASEEGGDSTTDTKGATASAESTPNAESSSEN